MAARVGRSAAAESPSFRGPRLTWPASFLEVAHVRSSQRQPRPDPRHRAHRLPRRRQDHPAQVPLSLIHIFRSYGKKDQADLIASLGGALAITDDESKYIMLSYFYKADSDYGTGLAKVAGADLQRVRQLAAKLQD